MDVKEKKLERADEEADKLWNAVYGDEPPADEKIEPKPEAKVEPDPPKKEEPPVDTTDWKQKYLTLEGKYRAEVPRLNDRAKQAEHELAKLNAKVLELESSINSNKTKEALVGDIEIDKLEADYPDIGKIVKKLRDGYESRINDLEKQITTNVSTEMDTVKTDLALTKTQQFDAEIRSLGVPDWKEIDVDSNFHEWLQDKVQYTNFTKLDILRDATRRLDSAAVAQMFLDYKSSIKKADPEPAKTDPQGKLEPYIAPSSTTVATQQRAAQTGYTRADYELFMKESSRGKFNPAKWGGKTEDQVEHMFETLILKKELR